MLSGRKRYRIKLFHLVLLTMVGYSLYICAGQQVNKKAIDRETQTARVKLEQLNQLNNHLTDERLRLNTPEYVEKIAREELGLVKPGEVPYIPGQKK